MLNNGHRKRKISKEPKLLFTDRTSPKTSSELAIHNKKNSEVRKWLQTCFATGENSFPRVLYLTGPTGSGKSTCVEVLCKELDIHIKEYEEEQLYNNDMELEEGGIQSLTRFVTESGARLMPGKTRRSILLVTSLPNQAYNDANEFRSSLRAAFEYVKLPIIFCLSNVDSSWHLNPNRLFTTQFLSESQIDTIKFNPAAISFVRKACNRAIALLVLPVSTLRVEAICEEANGDLRLSLNMLQMHFAGSKSENRNSSQTQEVFSGRANREETFHMLGRILHAKRVQPPSKYVPPMSQRRKKLLPVFPKPAETVEPMERTELEHDVNDIIRMSSMEGDKIVGFLHENEIRFCKSVPNLRKIYDDFSLCDSIHGNWSARQKLPNEYFSQISARSVMWYNFGSKKQDFTPVIGPVLHDLNREIDQSKRELRQSEIPMGSQYLSLTCPYESLMKSILDPYDIRSYLFRPLHMTWKFGRDQVYIQMETASSQIFYKRARSKYVANVEKYKKNEKNSDDEEIIIEESDEDDSFDEF